jgi:hypothetical protein
MQKKIVVNGSLDFDFRNELEKVVFPLINSGKKILLIGSVPNMLVNPPQYFAKTILFETGRIPSINVEEHEVSVKHSLNA